MTDIHAPHRQGGKVSERIALYVHWPFCVSKCPYCDFNSHVRAEIDQSGWLKALLADLAYEAAQKPDALLGSIFFGGGTPSLMPPATVAALIAAARNHWPSADDLEITLEANPSSVEASRFADLARAGVNRVSLGIQALDDETLAFLGRAHDICEGLAALDTAQRSFSRVSFDLIYARPAQSVAQWEAELTRALTFQTEHLSLYQLTIEPGTRFATLLQQGKLKPVDPDHGADLFEVTRSLTAARGLPAYEISNHARFGAESRHNLTYWRYGDYLGVGPGAHGRRNGLATVRHKKPENWMTAVARNGHGAQSEAMLLPNERSTEALLMGLRLREGVNIPAIEARTGHAQCIDRKAVARLSDLGFVEMQNGHMRVTETGFPVLDAILAQVVRT